MTSVKETLAGKHILVTGVTGFLGKVWLGMLLDRVPEIGRVTVLVRSQRKSAAEERFAEIASRSPALRPLRQKLGAEAYYRLLDEKIDVLDGDVSEPMCGLDERELARVTGTLDAVIHFAGLTDFEPDPVLGLETNVRGSENAADIAARARVPRFIHVSTAFVAGNVSGDVPEAIEPGIAPNGKRFDPIDTVAELQRDLAALDGRRERIDHANRVAADLGWPNIYTLTKGLSEHLQMMRKDVDVTIVRPSVVESSIAYPFPGWNEGINTSGPLVWLLSSWFRTFPSSPKHRFDVVPVDTVARGLMLVLAAQLRGEAERVYHLGSSPTNPLTFERAIDLTALAARRLCDKNGASAFERFFVKYLDAIPRHADHDPFPSLPFLRKTAQRARDALRDFNAKELLPPKLYARVGETLDERLKKLSMDCRNADRTIGRIEDMLRLYRPFIHDNDYVFLTDHVRALAAALSPQERPLFDFDIDALDWRTYWVDVHVPGLEVWSLPLLKNEKVPVDPPFPRPDAVPDTLAEALAPAPAPAHSHRDLGLVHEERA